jgi:hypothetical protein
MRIRIHGATVVFYFWSVLRLVLSNDNKQVLFSFGGWLDAGQGCSKACPSNAGHFC